MANNNLVITIERQYGSGGRIVGKKLAEDLGIHFYDEEILKMTSEVSAIGEQYFRLADEKAGNKLLYKIVGGLKNSLAEPNLEDKITSPDNLFRFQSSVIRKLASEEPCVIMGRCADFVLDSEGLCKLVSIFVCADMPTRIRRVMEVDGVDTKEALKRIARINKERTEYHKYYSGREWEDLNNYDLTINASKLDYDQVVQLIKEFLKIKGF
ncbi:cytidylate kinase-like family protein [Clostridium sp. MCC353]|uniref:cytidylate kinase-like family protein n=1 Tax=Clostridium sp. MCC353 TaxID=2592646 RepID=UPI001C01CE98|nr:cytidylate kinase-like family protein [Clostridium sp. MCC353]MBS6643541.1 cytidylate kinase-like family protein [Clostridiaceae bacterium]MBT9779307.1 cytidylate kinase-like family protein [Clostridium sp. MCC353]